MTAFPSGNTAFATSLGVASVFDTTRLAQTQFTRWADPKRPPAQRKTRDLIAAIGGDFFKLLDGLSIARSRRQIASYYAAEMQRLGGFPKRPAPKAIHAAIDLKQTYLSFEQLDTEISALRLALYHPTSFLRNNLPAEIAAAYEDKILGGFTQEGREKILVAMMKVNFLKRLESSVDSFRLTLQRTIDKIDRLETRIEAFDRGARNVAQTALQPWILRHNKGTHWVGTEIVRRQRMAGAKIGDSAAKDGLPIPPEQLLPFFLAARGSTTILHGIPAPSNKERAALIVWAARLKAVIQSLYFSHTWRARQMSGSFR